MKELIEAIKNQLGIKPRRYWVYAGWQFGSGKGSTFQCAVFNIEKSMIPKDYVSFLGFKDIIKKSAKIEHDDFAITNWQILSKMTRKEAKPFKIQYVRQNKARR